MFYLSAIIAVAPGFMLGLWIGYQGYAGLVPWQAIFNLGLGYTCGGWFMWLAYRLWSWSERIKAGRIGSARWAGVDEAEKRGLLKRKGLILAKKLDRC